MIGDKIKEKRLILNMTQAKLAELSGIKKNTISNYENNISSPSEENVIKLMNALKCDANYFFESEMLTRKSFVTAKELTGIQKYRTLDEYGKDMIDTVLDKEYQRCSVSIELQVPMLTIKHSYYRVSAGLGCELGCEDWEEIEIPATHEAREASFALTIKGDSMEPVYFDNDIVLVKKQETVEIGEIGIFTINGDGYIKKFGGNKLISLNSKYRDIYFNDNDCIKCCGKVIGRA